MILSRKVLQWSIGQDTSQYIIVQGISKVVQLFRKFVFVHIYFTLEKDPIWVNGVLERISSWKLRSETEFPASIFFPSVTQISMELFEALLIPSFTLSISKLDEKQTIPEKIFGTFGKWIKWLLASFCTPGNIYSPS